MRQYLGQDDAEKCPVVRVSERIGRFHLARAHGGDSRLEHVDNGCRENERERDHGYRHA